MSATATKTSPAISMGLTGTIDAHGECLKGFAAFLEKCDNLSDLQNMALMLRAYERQYKQGGWVGEAVESVLLDVGIRLAAGDDAEDIASTDSKYTPASNIGFHLRGLLRWLEDADVEFIGGLLKAIHDAHCKTPISLPPRAAVAQYLQSLDAPKPAQKRAPRRAKGGHRKAA